MLSWSIRILAAAATVAASTLAIPPGPAAAQPGALAVDIARARAATAIYHYEPLAIRDGYLRTDDCVASPAGTMGFHYVKPSLLDGRVDVREPEAVLYVPGEDGRRLVAVEYITIDADQNLATDGDRPTLFGQKFAGPMPGHGPGMPIHHDLHAWIWAENPNGIFAEWNPAVSC